MPEFDDPDEPIGDVRDRFEKSLAAARAEAKKAADEAAALKAKAEQADALQRKLAFAEAGIDLADKRAQLFIKGYDGELDKDKVQAAWKDYFGAPEPPKDQPTDAPVVQQQPAGVPITEIANIGQMDAALSGTPLPEGQSANLLKGMRDLYEQGAETEDIARFLGAHGYPVARGFEQ